MHCAINWTSLRCHLANSFPSFCIAFSTEGRVNGLSRLMQWAPSVTIQIWRKFDSTIPTDTNTFPSVLPRRRRTKMAQSPASFALRVRSVARLPGCVPFARFHSVPSHFRGRSHQPWHILPCGILRRIWALHTRGALKSWRVVGSRGRRPRSRMMNHRNWRMCKTLMVWSPVTIYILFVCTLELVT